MQEDQQGGIWWQTTNWRKVVSSLTGRSIILNLSDDQFLIPPTFSAEAVRCVARDFKEFWRSMRGASRPSVPLRPFLASFESVTDEQTFGHAINMLFEQGQHIPGPVNRGRITNLLVALWEAECLALPRQSSPLLGRFRPTDGFWGSDRTTLRDLFIGFDEVSRGQNKQMQLRILGVIALAKVGVREIGDLTPEVADNRLAPAKLGSSTATAMLLMMKAKYGQDGIGFTSDAYGPFGKQSTRYDDSFAWAVKKDPSLEKWRSLAEEWMIESVQAINSRRVSINKLFDQLIHRRDLPRDPIEFLSSRSVLPASLATDFKSRNLLSAAAAFLDWILATRCTGEDDYGHPYRLPGFRNPLNRETIPTVKHAESVRDAMPTRFVRRLREIIVQDDYAWPKQAFERGVDEIRWRNPGTGRWEDVWSPVRAFAIEMKLELPERTFQVRVANSGEADPERFNIATGEWLPNEHPLAGQLPYGKPMGLPRRIFDARTNSEFTGLYFNTNKTGDLGKAAADRGHVIPWQNMAILSIADRMRRWQEKYNPVTDLTPWSNIKEITRRFSPDILKERGGETFLFRDPCAAHTDWPVAATRLNLFWIKLCEELERRLAAEGELGLGGKPILLTNKGADGRTSSALYNLHSLRVTMITAWAEAGVPVDILMKVAGHATALMTIYYQKHSIAHVTEVLNTASSAMMLSEQGNWQAWLKSKSYEELTPLVAHNDPAGLSSLFESSPTSAIRRDHGICPVSCSRCHEGGPRVEGAVTKKHLPVPGGPQNCVRCRFFITGPCFLLGLSAHFDDVGFRYREASRNYVKVSADFERLDHERSVAVEANVPFLRHPDLERLSSHLDQRTREVDELAMTWHATYNLIQQSLGILKSAPKSHEVGGEKNALIVVGDETDFNYVLELDERGELEFELLDKICQSSIFFKSIDATVPNLKRMRRFDNVLIRSGHEPMFVHMSEDEALAVGNEYARYLYSKLGRAAANQIVSGRKTLEDFGIATANDLLQTLQMLVGTPAAKTMIVDGASRS